MAAHTGERKSLSEHSYMIKLLPIIFLFFASIVNAGSNPLNPSSASQPEVAQVLYETDFSDVDLYYDGKSIGTWKLAKYISVTAVYRCFIDYFGIWPSQLICNGYIQTEVSNDEHFDKVNNEKRRIERELEPSLPSGWLSKDPSEIPSRHLELAVVLMKKHNAEYANFADRKKYIESERDYDAYGSLKSNPYFTLNNTLYYLPRFQEISKKAESKINNIKRKELNKERLIVIFGGLLILISPIVVFMLAKRLLRFTGSKMAKAHNQYIFNNALIQESARSLAQKKTQTEEGDLNSELLKEAMESAFANGDVVLAEKLKSALQKR